MALTKRNLFATYMNPNHHYKLEELERRLKSPVASGTRQTDAELRALAEEIVNHCPSLTQLLLALSATKRYCGPN